MTGETKTQIEKNYTHKDDRQDWFDGVKMFDWVEDELSFIKSHL